MLYIMRKQNVSSCPMKPCVVSANVSYSLIPLNNNKDEKKVNLVSQQYFLQMDTKTRRMS